MNHCEDKLPALVTEELVAANLVNPPFHSTHEGYAVLKEEIEEAKEALDEITVCLDMLWEHVKKDSPTAYAYAQRIEKYAMRLAAEAIQVAAMAQKFQDSRIKTVGGPKA